VETYDKKDATQTYLTDTWEQQVMSFGDFVDNYIVSAGGSESEEEERGYLAQYQLFEQIPSLMNDIEVPSLCSAVTEEDSSAPLNSESTPPASPLVSAWFGPKGTVSPLHNDPYHNLLAQVVGSKYLRLYQASDTELVYPREGPMCNNSYINLDTIIDNPNESKKFPRFREAKFQHCILKPGELLYIPRHYWHYVRSLEMSFSSSFWWGAKMALQRVVAKDSKGKGGKDKDVKYVACY
jgi:lysine-specific demethylase 8